MGIDFGEKRIGIAMSDATGTLASPRDTLVRRIGRRPPWSDLLARIDDEEVERVVVGLPLELDGSETEWTREVRAFGAALAERSGRPVVFVDERFSSVDAEAAVRSAGLPRRKREEKARIDAAAAAVILQSWLDGAPER